MTDELAKAIDYYENVPHGEDSLLPILLEAARLYYNLPEVKEPDYAHVSGESEYMRGLTDGNNNVYKYLKATYPKGVKWK